MNKKERKIENFIRFLTIVVSDDSFLPASFYFSSLMNVFARSALRVKPAAPIEPKEAISELYQWMRRLPGCA
jgi:hypothetical protein